MFAIPVRGRADGGVALNPQRMPTRGDTSELEIDVL